MNNLLTTWSYGNSEIRTIKRGDTAWFVGKDVCGILGYSNARDAISKHVDNEDKGVAKCDTLGGSQDLMFINESGLYSLILSSKMPAAKEFKHWVTSEVLPTIRKTGGYGNEVVTVTPDLAREWLNHNVQNRKINMANVKRMADDIRNGKFYLNGDTIRFYDDGTLADGQCEELWNRYETEFTQLSNILKGSHHDYILSQREVRAYCVHLALSEKWNMNQIQDFVTGLKRKPNCVTNFDYTCYNFRNFYDRHVHNKLRDTKKFGEKTKMAHTLNALTIVADSYKTGKIYKSFAFKPTAKAILDKGCEIAQSCLSIVANTQLTLE